MCSNSGMTLHEAKTYGVMARLSSSRLPDTHTPDSVVVFVNLPKLPFDCAVQVPKVLSELTGHTFNVPVLVPFQSRYRSSWHALRAIGANCRLGP